MSTERRLRVLAIVERFLPGYKSGGPIQSVAALIEQLANVVDFAVLTGDRDDGDDSPYAGVPTGRWTKAYGAEVFYAPPRLRTGLALRGLIRGAAADVAYLNSVFAPMSRSTLFLRRCGLIPRIPLVIAPRGELSDGALSLKTHKKRAYLALARATGLYDGLRWHASSDIEASEVRRVWPDACVQVAPNLTRIPEIRERARKSKEPGVARLVFLSRISPKKNLLELVRMLRALRGRVTLHVYGSLQDRTYWDRCASEAGVLPPGIVVEYKGAVEHERVGEVLGQYDFFVLPTLGENFGHAIVEALAAGCPAVISDRTPWRELESRGVGFDVPLNDREAWQHVLQRCVDMSVQTHDRMRIAAKSFAAGHLNTREHVEASARVFLSAASDRASGRSSAG